MRNVVYQSGYHQKYFMEDIFEIGHFIEIDEECFNNLVVRFRACFDMHYEFCENCDKRIFTEKETGLRYVIERF